MRFYGWTWDQVMSMRTSAFWTCYGYIDRLRAEETLAKLPEMQLAQSDQSGATAIVRTLEDRIGWVVREAPHFDEQGWDVLKGMSQQQAK